MNILISACLLGINCKYNDSNNIHPGLCELTSPHTLIPICPEQLGGLPTPRVPAERKVSKVITKSGTDVTSCYKKGAQETLKIAQSTHCQFAILKERSPSCGSLEIYDGTFQKIRRPGAGVTTELLRKSGIPVFHENQETEINQIIHQLEKENTHE